jgi:hypothetical protein
MPLLDAAAGGELDLLGQLAERLGAELARFGFQRVRGKTRPAASRRCIASSIFAIDFSPSSRK